MELLRKISILESLKQMIAITVMRACAYVKWEHDQMK